MNTQRIAALSALSIAAALASGGALAQSKCGLGNGKKATGEPIAIGAVVGKTGPDDFSSSAQAAAAYFKCVNDNGGIHGRPIDYIVADDQWNPETAAQVASKLVKDRKVVVLAGSTSFVECGANAKMYADEGVMVIAGTGVPRECFNAKNYVPINSGPRISGTIAAMYAAQAYKSKKMVCIIPNIPSLGNWACEGPKEWGKKNDTNVEIHNQAEAEAIVQAVEGASFVVRSVVNREKQRLPFATNQATVEFNRNLSLAVGQEKNVQLKFFQPEVVVTGEDVGIRGPRPVAGGGGR